MTIYSILLGICAGLLGYLFGRFRSKKSKHVDVDEVEALVISPELLSSLVPPQPGSDSARDSDVLGIGTLIDLGELRDDTTIKLN